MSVLVPATFPGAAHPVDDALEIVDVTHPEMDERVRVAGDREVLLRLRHVLERSISTNRWCQ